MSEAEVLERPDATSTFSEAAENPSASQWSDAHFKQYVDDRNALRQRLIDGITNMRKGEMEQKKHGRELTFQFLKAGLGTSLNMLKSFKSASGLFAWTFNLFETGLQIANMVKNHGFVKAGFERDKGAYRSAIQEAIVFNRREAPGDHFGRSQKANFSFFVPSEITSRYMPDEMMHIDPITNEEIKVNINELRAPMTPAPARSP